MKNISQKFPHWLQLIWLLIVTTVIGQATPFNITTWQGNLQHTGLNNQETILTPATVSAPGNFGLLYSQPLDGQTYGQPLYMSGITVNGVAHNVIYVTTEHCSVYAYDADTNFGTNSLPLWHDSLIPAGTVPVPQADVGSGDIQVELGLTTTPVIDPSTNTLYTISKVKTTANATYQQYLHALDLSTGAEKFGGPVLINASFPGVGGGDAVGGAVPFSALHEHSRAAMILYNGVVYVSFASHSDTNPYHGEILGFNASNLQLIKTFITTPNGLAAGIWGGGAGPAIDPVTGNMFVAVANGAYDQKGSAYNSDPDWGESFIKLPTTGTFDVSYANPLNWFTPNIWSHLNDLDLDLGSSGVLLLPDQTSGPHTHLLVGGGKGGVLYVVDRDNMGGLNNTADAAVQEINENSGVSLFVTPAYYNGNIYYAGAGEPLTQRAVGYNPTNGNYIASTPIQSSFVFSGGKGSGCFISANNNTNGIVWILNCVSPEGLMAYDATNVSLAPIYTTTAVLSGGIGVGGAKFSLPIVSNGKVYFTGYDYTNTGHLMVYGILPTVSGGPNAPTNLSATAISASEVSLSWTSNSTNESGFIVSRSTSPSGPFTQVYLTGAGATTYTDTGLSPVTNYYYEVTATNTAGISRPTNIGIATTFPYYTPTGLVGYWPFDEGSGGTAADATGNGHTGTLNGEISWVTGEINEAITFHGTGYAVSNVDVPDATSFQFAANQSFTLSAWVNPGALRNTYEAVVTKAYNNGVGNFYGIWINGNNQWAFRGPTGDVVGTPATVGVWQHVAVVQDGVAGTRSIYVNGVLAGTGVAQAANGTGDLLVGMASGIVSPTPAQGFPGDIDEVRLYNRALAASEIPTLLSAPVLQAVSDQVQGTAGTFGQIIFPSAAKVIECRKGSTPGSYTLVLNFSAPVSGITGSLKLAAGGTAVGQVSSVTYNASRQIVTVGLTGVGNVQSLILHLSGILPGNGTTDIPFNVLWGDVNQDNVVNSLDQNVLTSNLNTAVNVNNALYDVNCDGQINAQDSTVIAGLLGTNIGTEADSNLALFQPATASSLESPGNPASAAVDGNLTTRWSSAFSDPQWITVNLGQPCLIHSVVLNWEHASGQTYTIQVSNDNATWTTIASEPNNPAGPIINTYAGLNATGQYVRMYGTARSTAYGYSLYEFEVFGIPASNGGGGGGTAPVITSSTTLTGTSGTPFSYQIVGSQTPTSYGATGLPGFLTPNATSGLITGTPTAAGTYNFSVSATNASGTGSANVVLTVAAAPVPVITSGLTATGTVGTPFSYQITASNTPTTFTAGNLPAGLSVNATTGVISGTPTLAGTYSVPLSAGNSSGTSPTATLVVTVNSNPTAPVINSPSTVTGNTGDPFSYQITATNTPTSYTSTTLPVGLTLNTATGVISGTPTLAGTSSVTIGAVNASGTGTATLSITIVASTDVNLSRGSLASASASSVQTTGLEANYAIDGNLSTRWSSAFSDPQWITVNLGQVCKINSVVINWEVAAGKTYTIQVSNDNVNWTTVATEANNTVSSVIKTYSGLNATGQYVRMYGTARVTIYGYSIWELQIWGSPTPATAPPAITSALVAAGAVGTPFNYQITASNNPTSYSASGLPGGVTLNTATGAITGTPVASGTYSVALTATNAYGVSPVSTLMIGVSTGTAVPAITSVLTAKGTTGAPFSYQIAASNSPTSYSASVLPAGLTFNGSTGVISGTPTAAGTTAVTIGATNANGSGTAVLNITVAAGADVNLALAATATASSLENSGYAASNAIDGNLATRWSSQFADPQYITVNLGQVRTIDSVVLDWEVAAGKTYTIQVSNDNVNWTTVATEPNNTVSSVIKTYSGLNASGQYVRMYGTARVTIYGYSLWEFQIWGH